MTSPIFQNEYIFFVNAPYEHLDRALFLRRSYWESHPMKSLLNGVPVSETSLGSLGASHSGMSG